MNEAKRLLIHEPGMEIQKIGELVGYKDGFYFSRVFKSYTGMQPSEFRGRNMGM
jgi:YesN/AraC family two-component response regulator